MLAPLGVGRTGYRALSLWPQNSPNITYVATGIFGGYFFPTQPHLAVSNRPPGIGVSVGVVKRLEENTVLVNGRILDIMLSINPPDLMIVITEMTLNPLMTPASRPVR